MDVTLKAIDETAPLLDSLAEKLQDLATPLFGEDGPAEIKDVLYGVPLGHPLHPAMTDITIGAWTTSMIADVLREHRASDVALAIGTASSVATALTGMAQWFDATTEDAPRRTGAAHAALNVAALGCYGVSLALRAQDKRAAGIATAWVGHTLATGAGWLGGHLSLSLGIGVNHDRFVQHPDTWIDTGVRKDDLADGEARFVDHEQAPLVLLRKGDTVYAASNVCSHLGGPLHEEPVDGTCLTCAWHGSVFDIADGSVVHGPATYPITTYDVRTEGDTLRVKPRA